MNADEMNRLERASRALGNIARSNNQAISIVLDDGPAAIVSRPISEKVIHELVRYDSRTTVQDLHNVPSRDNQLIVVLTDGIGPAWRDGTMGTRLAGWAKQSPTVILQLLPVSMWRGAVTEPKYAGPGRPAIDFKLDRPNSHWAISNGDYWNHSRPGGDGGIPIPVLALDDRFIDAAISNADALQAFVYAGDIKAEPAFTRSGTSTSMDKVRSFRATVTPSAYALAIDVASVPVFNMGVLEKLVEPSSRNSEADGTFANIQQLMLSGLVHRVADRPATMGGPLYAMERSARRQLLMLAMRSDVIECMATGLHEVLPSLTGTDLKSWWQTPGAILSNELPPDVTNEIEIGIRETVEVFGSQVAESVVSTISAQLDFIARTTVELEF